MTGIRHLLRTRKYFACLVAVMSIAVINLAIGSTSFQTGSTTPTSIPLSLILPAIAVTAIFAIGEPITPLIDHVASRPVHRYQTLIDLSLILFAAIALTATTAGNLGDEFSGWTVARNLIGLAGLTLLAALATRQLIATAAPIALVLIAAAVGRQDTPLTPAWSWLLDRTNTAYNWFIAIALLTAGIISRWTEPSRR